VLFYVCRKKLEASELRAREAMGGLEAAVRAAEGRSRLMEENVREVGAAMKLLESDREVHVNAHAVLLRQVDKEKVKNRLDSVSHRFKVLLLLLVVWGLVLGLMYEAAVDFRPCTHDDFRLTS
jgi:hypothetical protein